MHCNDEIMAQWNFYHHFCIYDFGKRKKNLYEVVEEWVSDTYLGFGYQMYDYEEKSQKQRQRQKKLQNFEELLHIEKKRKKLPLLA